MELLAPAGNRENFLTAIEAGADAVYLGAPRLNARNLARDLSLDEIAGMVAFAHECGRKVYVAANSLIRESDLPLVLKTLAHLERIGPDALIVQDLGLLRLITRFFQGLRVHGSTLMTTHNRLGTELLARLGCARAVLAQEMTLQEITELCRNKPVELEVFVHGAMCYSYSGLCLFSSYFGGKSGLRGNCVQPCRRKYSQEGGKAGYYFSMHDLEGLALVPALKNSGVDSLKIEGRLRSATYVEAIVKAYRLVIDAPAGQEAAALHEAAALIPGALGRKTFAGFFAGPYPKDAVSPQHSGNIGSFLGRIDKRRTRDGVVFGLLTLKHRCAVGERLRLHCEQSGERIGFTLERLFADGADVDQAEPGQGVAMQLPGKAGGRDWSGDLAVYLVDSRAERGAGVPAGSQDLRPIGLSAEEQRRIRKHVADLGRFLGLEPGTAATQAPSAGQRSRAGRRQSEIWLCTDDVHLFFHRLPFHVDRWVFPLNRKNISFAGRIKGVHKGIARDVVWALPPIIPDAALSSLQRDITVLTRSGFRTFQLALLSQHLLFSGRSVSLYGDYTLNILNSQAASAASACGLQGVQMSIEADRSCLEQLLAGLRRQPSGQEKRSGRATMVGLTVYGAPALFTSRLAPVSSGPGRPLVSPKNERFVIEKRDGLTVTRPHRPFSLLPFRGELEQFGINYVVIDLRGMKAGKKDLQDIGRRLAGTDKVSPLPSFNYRGSLD